MVYYIDRTSSDSSDQAYAAGLLHSIGKLGAVLLMDRENQDELSQINYNILNKRQSIIGEIILTKWNTPDKIMRAAIDFENPPEGTSDRHRLTAMVHVACGLSHLLGISFGKKICVAEISRSALARIGLADGLEPLLPAIFEDLRSAGLIERIEVKHQPRP